MYIHVAIHMGISYCIDSVPTWIMSLKELVATANQATEQSKSLSLACNCMYMICMYMHVSVD